MFSNSCYEVLEADRFHDLCNSLESAVVNFHEFIATERIENRWVITCEQCFFELFCEALTKHLFKFTAGSEVVVCVEWSFPYDATFFRVDFTCLDHFLIRAEAHSSSLVSAILNGDGCFIMGTGVADVLGKVIGRLALGVLHNEV